MGAGTSIFLIAVGAVMDFAVKVQNSHGFNINKIGLILMVVGVLGLILSLLFWSSWGGVGTYRRHRVVEPRRPPADERGGRVTEDPGTTYLEGNCSGGWRAERA
ncbi:MAG: hypothetical protein M3137_19755, partial [Actinomycetota bacterium]|nr:hypothetical protein [Actinomycetota bacterium]